MARNNNCNVISVVLDDSNYPTWLYQMQNHLKSHGLLKIVDGSLPCPPPFITTPDGSEVDNTTAQEKWCEQDSALITVLSNSLSAEPLVLIVGCRSSMEVWYTLKQRYASVSEAHVMQLKSELQNIQKGGDSIEKYLLRFKSIRDQLAVMGIMMSEQDVKVLILAGLPVEYGHTRQIIRGKTTIDLSEVRSLLLSAESEIALEQKALPLNHFSAMFAQNGGNSAYSGMPYVGNTIFNTAIPWSANCAAPASFNMHNGFGNVSNCTANGSNLSGASPSVNTMGFMAYGPQHSSTGFFNAPTSFGSNCSSFMNTPGSTPIVNSMTYGPQQPTTAFVSAPPNSGFVQQMGYGIGPQAPNNGFAHNHSSTVFTHAPQVNSRQNDGNFQNMFSPNSFFSPNTLSQNTAIIPFSSQSNHMPPCSTTISPYAMSGSHSTVGFVPPPTNATTTQLVSYSPQMASPNLCSQSYPETPQFSNQNTALVSNYTPQNGDSYPQFPSSNGRNSGNNSKGNNFYKNMVCQICDNSGHSAARCNQRNNVRSDDTTFSSTVECQICKKPGHIAKTCRWRNANLVQNQSGNTAMMACAANSSEGIWLVDSGATNHMTSDINNLQNITSYNSADTVQIGQGHRQSLI